MNILFIAYNFTPYEGGIQRVTDILTKELIKRGHNVYYLCGCNEADGKSYNTAAKLYYMDKPMKKKFDKKSILYYKELLCSLQINIIILQYPIFQKSLFFLKYSIENVGKISVFHNQPFPTLVNTKNSIIVRLRFKIRSILRNYKYARLFSNAIRLSDKFCLLSDKFENRILKHISVDNSKLVAINNPNIFNLCDENKFKKENILLFVGRISNIQKNVFGFVDVWEIISKNNPSWDAYVVGDGPDLCEVKKYVNDKKIERIHFEGYQKDVTFYYKKAKILCVTSFFEGWGLILPESMAYSCVPVVYGSFESVYDIVSDNVNGYIVSPFDKEEMANKIEYLIRNEKEYLRMSLNAKELSEKFDVVNIVDEWERLFDKITINKKILR